MRVQTVFLSILLVSGLALAGSPPAASEKASRDSVQKAVKDTLQGHVGSLGRCYPIVARSHDGVVVHLSVDFEIASDGHVPTARIAKSDHRDGLFESCIVDAFRSWTFPQPPGGLEMKVSYPLMISSASDVAITGESRPGKAKKKKALE